MAHDPLAAMSSAIGWSMDTTAWIGHVSGILFKATCRLCWCSSGRCCQIILRDEFETESRSASPSPGLGVRFWCAGSPFDPVPHKWYTHAWR